MRYNIRSRKSANHTLKVRSRISTTTDKFKRRQVLPVKLSFSVLAKFATFLAFLLFLSWEMNVIARPSLTQPSYRVVHLSYNGDRASWVTHGNSRKVNDMGNKNRRKHIGDSKHYKDLNDLVHADSDCELMYEWQKTTRPLCNTLHEFDASSPLLEDGVTPKYQYFVHGYYRDVWTAIDAIGVKFVFKPMRYRHKYTYRNFDRMRRDTMTMDRLVGEKYILNIHAACGTSGFFEYASEGDIEDTLWPKDRRSSQEQLKQIDKLHIATQTSMALASVHNIDKEGQATIAHTDIAPSQWIKTNGIYKLNDFNRARFLKYNKKTGAVCPFRVGNNAGKNRSPEEYQYGDETEKVDIFSLGNLFYMLLQMEWPFEDLSDDEAQERVLNGTRPGIYEDLWTSSDPINHALKEAMIRCHEQSPGKRATAREISNFFRGKMQELDPGRLEEWGDA